MSRRGSYPGDVRKGSSASRRRFLKQIGAAAAAAGTASLASDTQGGRPAQKPAERAQQPNILFFFPDQQRFDWTGLNSDLPLRTPNFNRVAQRGVHFRNAYCASPLCGPSRACLASGKEYDNCRVPRHGINYPLDQTTFYTLLHESGYHVMGCGKFDLHKGTDQPQWGIDGQSLIDDYGFSAGIDNAGKWDAVSSGTEKPLDPYMAYLEKEGLRQVHLDQMNRRRDDPRLDQESWGHYKATFPTPLPERAYCDNWIARNGLDLIRAAPVEKPWFLQVNFAGPHEPMDITHRMDTAMRARDPSYPPPTANTQLTPEKHQAIRRNYAAMIENIDRWLGIYLDELDKRGELDNTVIVYSSDHGEMLGDYNYWAKSRPHEPSVGVPLTVAGPGVRKGHVSDALVSVVDIAATSVDLAGAQPVETMDARSLLPVLSGATDRHRDYLRSGLYGWRAVRDERYKLVRGFHPDEGLRRNDGATSFEEAPTFLFDLGNDPLEQRNIADRMPKRVRTMSEHIFPS